MGTMLQPAPYLKEIISVLVKQGSIYFSCSVLEVQLDEVCPAVLGGICKQSHLGYKQQ